MNRYKNYLERNLRSDEMIILNIKLQFEHIERMKRFLFTSKKDFQ